MSISKSPSDVPGNGNLHPDHMPQSNLTYAPVGLQPTELYEEEPDYCCFYMNKHDPRCCVIGRDCNGHDPCPKPILNLGTSCGKVTCGGCMLLGIAAIILVIVL